MGSRNRFNNPNKKNKEKEVTKEVTKEGYDDVIAFKPQAGVVSSGNSKALRYPKERQISDNTDYVSLDSFITNLPLVQEEKKMQRV